MQVKLVSTAILLMATIGFLSSCGNEKPQEKVQDVIKVTAIEIKKQSGPAILRYSGNTEPENTAQIGFAVPGVVKNIYVQEGQKVHKGQLLAGIDDTEFANALIIANAGLEQAEDMYARLDGLYKKGSLPEKDYIEIKTKLAQAKANKSINAKRIADSKLYAPISGIITAKMIEQGSTAAPGVPAFTIVKTDQLYAKISVPESEVGAVKPGTEASVFIPALSETFKGKVSIIIPKADDISRTFTTKIKLDNRNGKILPGMISEISINTDRKMDVIQIPASAIIRDADGIPYVFIAGTDNHAIRKRIVVGDVSGNNEVIIKEGLNVGDKLITQGHTRLKDGSSIAL